MAAVLAASLGGAGAGFARGSAAQEPRPAVPVSAVPVSAVPVSEVSAVPVSQVTVLPTGSSSNGGCQFNNNTINSGPGFDRRDLPFFSGRGFHRHGVPFLGGIVTDLMRRCFDQMDNRGGGFSHRDSLRDSHSDD
ncbi:MAG TPA: hypothetical protein VH008_25690 [Pseudonocardia sp.]|nr:hypothetical protein [Pseudonocardia sp.]